MYDGVASSTVKFGERKSRSVFPWGQYDGCSVQVLQVTWKLPTELIETKKKKMNATRLFASSGTLRIALCGVQFRRLTVVWYRLGLFLFKVAWLPMITALRHPRL